MSLLSALPYFDGTYLLPIFLPPPRVGLARPINYSFTRVRVNSQGQFVCKVNSKGAPQFHDNTFPSFLHEHRLAFPDPKRPLIPSTSSLYAELAAALASRVGFMIEDPVAKPVKRRPHRRPLDLGHWTPPHLVCVVEVNLE